MIIRRKKEERKERNNIPGLLKVVMAELHLGIVTVDSSQLINSSEMNSNGLFINLARIKR